LTEKSLDKDYKGKVRSLIEETMKFYAELNPEVMLTRNGEKVNMPVSYYDELKSK
jgi:hypothetical protein